MANYFIGDISDAFMFFIKKEQLIHTDTDLHRDTHTHRYTERQTDRQTHTQYHELRSERHT